MTLATRRAVVAGGVLMALGTGARGTTALPRVAIEGDFGVITVELAADRAPVTVANFLRYVDRGLYRHGAFYRIVRPDNDHNPATISVVQGGLDPRVDLLPPIAHEDTRKTGLRNRAGVLSMARDTPGSATSEFSISVTDNPALDFGGARQADGQGFAAFGYVVSGMDIVRRLDRLPATGASDSAYTAGQMLDPRIPFRIRRLR